jgi:hypothetical protein
VVFLKNLFMPLANGATVCQNWCCTGPIPCQTEPKRPGKDDRSPTNR